MNLCLPIKGKNTEIGCTLWHKNFFPEGAQNHSILDVSTFLAFKLKWSAGLREKDKKSKFHQLNGNI